MFRICITEAAWIDDRSEIPVWNADPELRKYSDLELLGNTRIQEVKSANPDSRKWLKLKIYHYVHACRKITFLQEMFFYGSASIAKHFSGSEGIRIRRAGKYHHASRKPSSITVCITVAINVIREALKIRTPLINFLNNPL